MSDLAKVNQDQNQLEAIEQDGAFVPQTREQFEMIRELQEAEAALDGLELPKKTSKELAASGEVFDIIDAFSTAITGKDDNPKTVVVFMCENEVNGVFAVMKDGNSINLQYAEFFAKFKAIGRPQRRNGYNFIERLDLPKKAGNHPIVLAKAPKTVKTVNAK